MPALSLIVRSRPFLHPTALENRRYSRAPRTFFCRLLTHRLPTRPCERALGAPNLEYLNLLLAFVRTAHYWTKLHPELALEDDVSQLLATHEALASCILKDPEAQKDSLSRQVAAELASLRKLRKQHESMTQAYQELSADHQYVKHNLHVTEQNLRELVSVMPAAVCACDRDGVITYYNRQAVDLWGRTPGLGRSAVVISGPTPNLQHGWDRSSTRGRGVKRGPRDRCSDR